MEDEAKKDDAEQAPLPKPAPFPFAAKQPRISREQVPQQPHPRQLSVAALKQPEEKAQEHDEIPSISLSGGSPPPQMSPAPEPLPYVPPPAPQPTAFLHDEDWIPESPRREQSVVTVNGIAAAAIAGAAMTLLWVVATWLMDYQWAIGGWLIGLSIGYASMRAGGRGFYMGMICAGLVIPCMVAGRAAGFFPVTHVYRAELSVGDKQTGDLAEAVLMLPGGGISPQRIAAFNEALGEDILAMKKFMVAEGFLGPAEDITDEEAMDFIAEYSTYAVLPDDREELAAELLQSQRANLSRWEVFWQTVNPWDLSFLIFGMISAFMIGGAKDGDL